MRLVRTMLFLGMLFSGWLAFEMWAMGNWFLSLLLICIIFSLLCTILQPTYRLSSVLGTKFMTNYEIGLMNGRFPGEDRALPNISARQHYSYVPKPTEGEDITLAELKADLKDITPFKAVIDSQGRIIGGNLSESDLIC